jgi:hypothetical protein
MQEFALAGLAVAVIAVAAAAWFGHSILEQSTSLIGAAVLAAGDTLAALWAAGPEERKARPLAWARCGLIAAVLTFVGLWAIIIPALTASAAAAERGQTAMSYGIGAFALLGGAIAVFSIHRFAWRRAAPKAAA